MTAAGAVIRAQEGGQRPIFRVKVDMVVLSFQVTDNKGHYVDRKSTRLNSSHLGISYAVFQNAEIRGLQSVDIVTLVIGHLKTEHHHIDLDTENGPLSAILRAHYGAGRGHSKKSSSRNRHDGLPGIFPTNIKALPSVRPPEIGRAHV